MSTHADWADDAAAYVLGALPPADVERFRTHLEGCPECRRAVEELQMAADALPMASRMSRSAVIPTFAHRVTRSTGSQLVT